MYKHYIILCSAYSIGTRIALDYCDNTFRLDLIKQDIEYIKKVCGYDVPISTHMIQTESKEWNSVFEVDKFFKDVKLVSTKEEFTDYLLKDKDLIGLDIAKYILSQISCTHLKLEKLVYMCYADYLCHEGEKLFNDKIFAYKLGPVINSIYEKYKKSGSNYLEEDNVITYSDDKKMQSRSRILVSKDGLKKLISIDKTLEKYKNFTASQLVELTHRKNSPWNVSGEGQVLYKEITDDLIINFHKYEES